jgi:hypothetical protein
MQSGKTTFWGNKDPKKHFSALHGLHGFVGPVPLMHVPGPLPCLDSDGLNASGPHHVRDSKPRATISPDQGLAGTNPAPQVEHRTLARGYYWLIAIYGNHIRPS